ncbi:TetR/AcrR family transcriptional regulator [Clostridiaceae bacterium M8S5]|nr:TetR/AcrR family transcriptional regulator [Clostridiaceae bacterium M8S5]
MKINKKDDIVKYSLELFNKYGTKKVTVEEICSKSNISKGTFYKYFSNKTSLLIYIVTLFINDSNGRFKNLLDEKIKFETLVKAVLQLKEDFMQKYSSDFLMSLYSSGEPKIKELLNKLHEDSINNSMVIYQIGLAQKKISNDITPEFFLYQLELIDKSRNDPRVINMYPDVKKRNMVIFELFFYGLIKRF